MFHKAISFLFAALIFLGSATSLTAFAQEQATDGLQAVVSAREYIQVDKNIIFNAARSFNPAPERPVSFAWDFGDGSTSGRGEEVAHVYHKPGMYDVELTMQVGAERDRVSFPLFVFQELTLLVTDDIAHEEAIAALSASMREQGNLLAVARGFDATIGLLTEEGAISAALGKERDAFQAADTVIVWGHGASGLHGLTRYMQESTTDIDMQEKHIVIITDSSLDALARIARGSFMILQPQQILLTRSDALRDIVLNGISDETPTDLIAQAIPHRIIASGAEDFSFFTPLSFLINYLTAQGIPASVILLILMLPVIATIVAFLKQVVGITTFGVYTPSIVTLSFLTIGLQLGLMTLAVVLIASIAVRRLLRRYRMSYTPRMALVLSAVALAVLATIIALTYLTPLSDKTTIASLISTSIFPMLIMSTLAEKFVSIQTEKGARSALRLLGEVTLVAVICYLIVGEWEAFRTFMLATPELIFAFLAANIVLGRYTGLRISEYIRFKDIIHRTESEE